MKSFEILSALPDWAAASADALVDSPAFAMSCRLGEEGVTMRLGAVQPADTLDLLVQFEEARHVLGIARSPRFSELDALWENRASVPEPILLALVEKECGPLLQLLENAVRRQLRLVGVAPGHDPDARRLFGQVADIAFSLTRSPIVVSALGRLRNLDLAHPSIREVVLAAEVEYVTFAMSRPELAGLEPGDALLLPEIGTRPPQLVVDGRFVADANGVSPCLEDDLVHVRAVARQTISLGELMEAAEKPVVPAEATQGLQLHLVQRGKTVANGRLDRLGEQNAFVVEVASAAG